MNWRDYISVTAIVAVIIVIGIVLAGSPIIQHITNWSLATALVAILGLLLAFVISPIVAPTSKPESITTALLGIGAVILAVCGLVANNKWLFLCLCITLIVLWTLTTIYHIQEHEERHVYHLRKSRQDKTTEV